MNKNTLAFSINLISFLLLATSLLFINSRIRVIELQQVKENTEILDLYKDVIQQQVILNAIGEDYPPKMKLGNRAWCLDRSCLDSVENPLQ